jgi:hypothetical protein
MMNHPTAATYRRLMSIGLVTYEAIDAYVRRHCAEYDHVYLIIRKWYRTHSANWDASFGPFIADLVANGPSRYPGYRAVADLEEAYVLRIEAPTCPR